MKSALRILIAISLLSLASCATNKEVLFHNIASLQELEGTWESKSGKGLEYPVTIEKKRYVRFYSEWKNCTADWKKISAATGETLEELWERRFSLPYTSTGGKTLPYSDENMNETGVIFSYSEKEGIRYRTEILATELVAAQNLAFFSAASDGTAIKEDGIFCLFSSCIDDIRETSLILKKQGE